MIFGLVLDEGGAAVVIKTVACWRYKGFLGNFLSFFIYLFSFFLPVFFLSSSFPICYFLTHTSSILSWNTLFSFPLCFLGFLISSFFSFFFLSSSPFFSPPPGSNILTHLNSNSIFFFYPRGHGVSGSALLSFKQGQGFDLSLCMKNLFWGALYSSMGQPGASMN